MLETIKNLTDGQIMVFLGFLGISIYFMVIFLLHRRDQLLQIYFDVFKKVAQKRGYQFDHQANNSLTGYANALIAGGTSVIITLTSALLLTLIRHWK